MATLAPSLVRMWREVDRRWPTRDHWSDGWLGDDSHATRFSDHNPADPNPPGYVHATDTDATLQKWQMGTGSVGDEVCAAYLRLARSGRAHPINYVIYKGLIWSRSSRFQAHRYVGSNSHHSHVHCSILRTTAARNWAGSWGINLSPLDASKVERAFRGNPLASPVHVARLQNRLRAKGYLKWPYTVGRAGGKTKDALKRWQKRNGYKVTGIPGINQVRKIAPPDYRAVR